ncbi:MAG: hypothetical protein JO030_04815 [Candidatus Eremiobacteraeota bacterium]|nr:hypothetical protein [Candidatus Eremiobacteraeota bacterium]
MRALIDWSYELLTADEQRRLCRVSVFLRGFDLDSAAKVCALTDDRLRLLDDLGSLVDKSMIVLESSNGAPRYRLLEPIREYAYQKLDESGALPDAQALHGRAVCAMAEDWYDEWDHGPPADWLARIQRDVANLRAALRWCVEQANDLPVGARVAAAATIAFLRQGFLNEGALWCHRVLATASPLPPPVEARLRYGLSMLFSSLGDDSKCLAEAVHAVSLYRVTDDTRGLARALSQVASRLAFGGRLGDAETIARESLELARGTGDRRLIADALRRCAEAFAAAGTDAVRKSYGESTALFKSIGRNDETARALTWWGNWELHTGGYAAATRLLEEAVRLEDSDAAAMFPMADIASAYLALGDRVRAELYARKTLAAVSREGHEVLSALALSYLAAVAVDDDAVKSARLLGNADARLRSAGWTLQPPDTTTLGHLRERLQERFADGELQRLFHEGAAWSNDQAVSHALAA